MQRIFNHITEMYSDDSNLCDGKMYFHRLFIYHCDMHWRLLLGYELIKLIALCRINDTRFHWPMITITIALMCHREKTCCIHWFKKLGTHQQKGLCNGINWSSTKLKRPRHDFSHINPPSHVTTNAGVSLHTFNQRNWPIDNIRAPHIGKYIHSYFFSQNSSQWAGERSLSCNLSVWVKKINCVFDICEHRFVLEHVRS